MVLDLREIELLANGNSKYDPKLQAVIQALRYLKTNGIDTGKIKDYNDLLQILKDWQNIDLKYEKTIIGEIDKVLKNGIVPDKITLDRLVASYDKFLSTKPARIKLKSRVYELAMSRISNHAIGNWKNEIITSTMKDISKNHPDYSKTQKETIQKNIENQIDQKLAGEPTEKKERVEYKIDPRDIRDKYMDAKDVESWIKENHLTTDLKKEQIEELKKGLEEAKNLRIKVDEIKGEINNNAKNIVNQVENKLDVKLPSETKDALINDIKLSFDSENTKTEIGEKLFSRFDDKLKIAPEKTGEIKNIIEQGYKTKDALVESIKDSYGIIREEIIPETIAQKVKTDGVEKAAEYIRELKIKDGETFTRLILENKDAITANVIRSEVAIEQTGTFLIIENAILEKNVKLEAVNDLINNLIEKNAIQVNSPTFVKNLRGFIQNDSLTSGIYKQYTEEIDNFIGLEIKKRAFSPDKIEQVLQNLQGIEGVVQTKTVELQTAEFIKSNSEIVAFHRWELVDKEVLAEMARMNPEIAPYLLDKKLQFPKGMSLEKIGVLQADILIAERLSHFVRDFYHPKLFQMGWDGGVKGFIKQYESLKGELIKNLNIFPYGMKKCANLEKFYVLVKNNPKIAFQIDMGQKIARVYQRLDWLTFGSLTRTGQAEHWIAFSKTFFGRPGEGIARMWLNNFVKGAKARTPEQALAKFLGKMGKELGKRVVGDITAGIGNIVSTAASTAVSTAASAVGKKGLQAILKGIISNIAGAASGGIAKAIIVALDILKKLGKPISKFLKSMGFDSKKIGRWLKDTLGIGPGAFMAGLAAVGGFLVALPTMIMAFATAMLAVAGPYIAIILGGLFLYQLFIGQQVSSLVPPKKYGDKPDPVVEVPKKDEKICYVTRDGVELALIPIDSKDVCKTNIDNPVCDKKEKILTYVGEKFCAVKNKDLCYLESHVYEMYVKMINAATDYLKKYDLLKVAYGYRDYGGQVEMWDSYCSNKHESSCPASGCTPKDDTTAACPGTSIHQTGRAIDLNFNNETEGGEYLIWLNNNAHKYGFERTVSGEPWHWEYTAKLLAGEKEKCEGD